MATGQTGPRHTQLDCFPFGACMLQGDSLKEDLPDRR